MKVGICMAGRLCRHAGADDLSEATRIKKRQLSIKRAFPDALDLLLICVESGMSIELAFRKVATEIGSQSIPLAEEFTLTTAELSYLSDRKIAYDNLQKRTGLDGVKSVCHGARAVGALRHAARHHVARDGAGKSRCAHDAKRRRRPRRCRRC